MNDPMQEILKRFRRDVYQYPGSSTYVRYVLMDKPSEELPPDDSVETRRGFFNMLLILFLATVGLRQL